MSRYRKKRSIIEKAKAQARSIRDEATIQAVQSTSSGGIAQLWRNYIDTIDRAVKEFKHSRKKKQ